MQPYYLLAAQNLKCPVTVRLCSQNCLNMRFSSFSHSRCHQFPRVSLILGSFFKRLAIVVRMFFYECLDQIISDLLYFLHIISVVFSEFFWCWVCALAWQLGSLLRVKISLKVFFWWGIIVFCRNVFISAILIVRGRTATLVDMEGKEWDSFLLVL